MKFVPIDPTGKSTEELLAEIAQGVNATHSCIHAFRDENARAHDDAAKKRHQMSNDMMRMQKDIKTVAESVGELAIDRDATNGRVKRLAEMFGADKEYTGPKPKPIGTWNAKKAGLVGVFVIIAAIVTNAATYGLIKQLAITTDSYLSDLARK